MYFWLIPSCHCVFLTPSYNVVMQFERVAKWLLCGDLYTSIPVVSPRDALPSRCLGSSDSPKASERQHHITQVSSSKVVMDGLIDWRALGRGFAGQQCLLDPRWRIIHYAFQRCWYVTLSDPLTHVCVPSYENILQQKTERSMIAKLVVQINCTRDKISYNIKKLIIN